jgi:hypothetical protein
MVCKATARIENDIVDKTPMRIRVEARSMHAVADCSGTGAIWRHHAGKILADELAQEFLFIHAVLEGFVTVDEDHGNLVSEAMTQVVVAVNVHLAPNEAASTL